MPVVAHLIVAGSLGALVTCGCWCWQKKQLHVLETCAARCDIRGRLFIVAVALRVGWFEGAEGVSFRTSPDLQDAPIRFGVRRPMTPRSRRQWPERRGLFQTESLKAPTLGVPASHSAEWGSGKVS